MVPAMDETPTTERAVDTELVRRIQADWRLLVESRRFRTHLNRWGVEDPRLAFPHGDDLVAAARRRDTDDWRHRDQALSALLARVGSDALARRVALQVVLPGVVTLIDTVRGWDIEERASRVVAEAVEVLERCSGVEAGTAPNFRVFANTRRRVLRAAIRDRNEPVTPTGVAVESVAHAEPGDGDPSLGAEAELRELVEWISTEGGVRRDVAGEVVLTRSGGVDVDHLAEILGVSAQTLRRRRLRTEQRLARTLSLER